MAILHCTPLPFLSLRTTLYSAKTTLTLTLTNPTTTKTRNPLFLAMNTLAKSEPVSSSGSSSSTYEVPELDANDMDRVADNAFRRYTWNTKRSGKGTAIVWFRNDLRVLDNEALYKAWLSSETVLPVYCVDPRLFATTYHFGFPKTGALRAQFLLECVVDLRKNLMKKGLNLLVQHGKPEEILPSLAKAFQAHTVYAQKETCSEELNVERLVMEGLKQVATTSGESSGVTVSNNILKLQLVWGTTMYHLDDLPFDATSLPDMYTQFRKARYSESGFLFTATNIIEAKCTIRSCIKLPPSLGPPPLIEDWGCLPSLEQLGLCSQSVIKGMKFVGGETAGLSRVYEYFWKKDLLKVYKETRNGMLGPDYSTKFSPWLASGSLSPRFIYEEVEKFDVSGVYRVMLLNSSGFDVQVVLGKFIATGAKTRICLNPGEMVVPGTISIRDSEYPLIDANMKELSTTGFMSNRGRQIVCSFLVRDMGIDWRMGAEWFETCLLDYDPCSNYGNWTYGSGVGNDPREDRYFSIPKQAQTYDPEGEYVAFWLPQLQKIQKEKRNFPGNMYIPQIVPLKFGTITGNNKDHRSLGARRINHKGNERKLNFQKK
ncbi:hypothetical protein V8G54_008457 [Vigna mungo]|uniref:Photolyase/cryptochrome alpha/beta domain-containing protein n=1 Tax=Vigna mungo TaxID=3915 RepID=A0AAQ3P3T4_VIGMU